MAIIDHLRLAHGKVTHEIIGAFYDVYNGLGYGYMEAVYANAMAIALASRGLRFEREKTMRVYFRQVVVGEFRTDYFVEDCVVAELKAAERIVAAHEAQLLNFLRASGQSVGLVLNFGPTASKRRVIWTGSAAHLELTG